MAELFEQDKIEWAKLIEESRETVFDRIQYMKDEIKVLREKREARKKRENDNAYYNLWKLVNSLIIIYNNNNNKNTRFKILNFLFFRKKILI